MEPNLVTRGWRYLAVTADVQVKAGRGILHSVIITTPATTAGVITLYDSLTETGIEIASIRVDVVGNDQMQATLIFDTEFTTGLYVGYDGTIVAARITVTYD